MICVSEEKGRRRPRKGYDRRRRRPSPSVAPIRILRSGGVRCPDPDTQVGELHARRRGVTATKSMSPLLPQSGGFEGLIAIDIGAPRTSRERDRFHPAFSARWEAAAWREILRKPMSQENVEFVATEG